MANRRFNSQFNYSFHAMPVSLSCNISIGAAGAVSSFNGAGINSVTRLSAGIYQIQVQDNYSNLFKLHATLQSPVSGGNVADGAFSIGTIYQITAVGTTNWNAAGLPAGLTAQVGSVFKAANAGGAGSGTAKILGVSGVNAIEIIGKSSAMLAPQPSVPNQGGYITIQCLGPTAAGNTAQIPTDPANGSILYVAMELSNSSVVINGE